MPGAGSVTVALFFAGHDRHFDRRPHDLDLHAGQSQRSVSWGKLPLSLSGSLTGFRYGPYRPPSAGPHFRRRAGPRTSGPTRHATNRFRQYSGLASISESRRQAIGLGERSPCSQDLTVDGSTPRNAAKAAWLIASRSRTLRTPSWRYSAGGADLVGPHGEPRF